MSDANKCRLHPATIVVGLALLAGALLADWLAAAPKPKPVVKLEASPRMAMLQGEITDIELKMRRPRATPPP